MTKFGMTTKDLMNAKGGSTSLQKMVDKVITVTGMATDVTTDSETGKEINVSYLASADGTVYGAVSGTVNNSVEMIINALEEGDLTVPMDIRVNGNTSNGGRTFLTITIL